MVLDVFLSYSHKDKPLRDELATHLSNLKRQGVIRDWYDGDITPGVDWKAQIQTHLDTSQLILLLISADFMASDFCYSVEMQQAITRHQAKQACVVPIILRPTDWEGAPFSHLKALPTNGKPVTDWKTHDQAFTNVIKGLRATIAAWNAGRIITPSPDPSTSGTTSMASISSQMPLWTIPFRRNPLFTGREEVFQRIHEAFTASKHAALTQAISGLGGIGKTQTALEYAYRYQVEYEAIFWVRAGTREDLLTSLTQLAYVLKLPEQHEQEQQRILAAVQQWFQGHSRWLLIVDNADELAMVQALLPTHTQGHLLLTTRAQAVRSLARKIELVTLSLDESIRFLLVRTGVLDQDEETALASIAEPLRASAEAIARTLGCLPLALDQAGAYIEETGISLSDYLALYQQERKALLSRRGGLEESHVPVATTWSLAFSKLAESHPAAVDVMRVSAFLAPDSIAEELLMQGAASISQDVQRAASSPLAWSNMIAELGKYSLVQRQPEAHMLSLHRLVQAVISDEMEPSIRQHWSAIAIQLVVNAFPFHEVAPWTQSQRYISNALTCLDHADKLQIEGEETYLLRYNVATYFYDRGQYSIAQVLFELLLHSLEQQLGPEHPYTLSTYHILALLYQDQGKYEQAQTLYEQVLRSAEQQVGPEHPATLTTRHNLARLYQNQGKYEQAQALNEQVLHSREQQLGPEHPDTLGTRHNLALLYLDQGKYEQAQALFEQVLRSREQQLGPEHPDTLRAGADFANLYLHQGKYEQAQTLYEQVLHSLEQQLGPEHPDTLMTRQNLANLYAQQSKYEQAQALFEQVLLSSEQQLGPEHPATLMTRHNLAVLYLHQGKYEQAQPLIEQVLRSQEQQLGSEHPETLSSRHNLASLYTRQGKYEQAQALYEQVLHSREQQLGPEHPETSRTRRALAKLYADQDKKCL